MQTHTSTKGTFHFVCRVPQHRPRSLLATHSIAVRRISRMITESSWEDHSRFLICITGTIEPSASSPGSNLSSRQALQLPLPHRLCGQHDPYSPHHQCWEQLSQVLPCAHSDRDVQ